MSAARVFCMKCGEDLDERGRCRCVPPVPAMLAAPPTSPTARAQRRFIALCASGVPGWQANQLANREELPS